MTSLRVVARAGTVATVALVAVLGLSLVSCANDSDDSSAATVPPAPGEGNGLTDGENEAPDDGGGATPGTVPAADRKLVIRVTVGVEVDDVAASVDQVIALAARHGGELSNSSMDLSNPRTAGGDLVFRLPPDETDAFIAELDPGIGRRTALQTSTDDVTLQSKELATRIDNARASLDRVRALLAEAKDIGEVIALESELTDRQNTLEQLLAEKTYLDAQVALSTVTVHLSATGTAPQADGDDSIGDAFREGWDGFVAFLAGIVRFVGYTLPFLVLFGAIAGVAWAVRRRMVRRSRSDAPLLPPAQDEDLQTSAPGS